MLAGCASPGSLRKDGSNFIFTTPKGTPQEFSRCLINQLDEKRYISLILYHYVFRDNIDGNVSILMYSDEYFFLMYDINKTNNGLKILIYSEWFKDQAWRDAVYPLAKEALNVCGAKE